MANAQGDASSGGCMRIRGPFGLASIAIEGPGA
jgi:hypothetical protein